MSELPKSFLIVVAFLVIAIGLVVYFGSRSFWFRRHKQKAEAAFLRRDYPAAIKSFAGAEALWELNVTRQTTASYLRDLASLDELLCGLEAAATAGGIKLEVGEYREAVKTMTNEFKGNGAGRDPSSGKTYASAFMQLENARSALREQLRLNGAGGQPQ